MDPSKTVDQNGLREISRDFRAVVQHYAGRIGVAAVDDQLELCGSPRAKRLSETGIELQHGTDVTAINEDAGTLRVSDAFHDIEIARVDEAGGQLPADDAIVEIVYGRCDVSDVERHRISEHKHLKDRHDEDDCFHLRIPEDLDEFLDEHVPDALEHRLYQLLLEQTVGERHQGDTEDQQ